MKIKIFADGSNIDEIFYLYDNVPLVKGFTTNPSLMKKAGVTNYTKFIKDVVSKIQTLPISFEVIADDVESMVYQAQKIAEHGKNINIKIPITNTKGEYTFKAIEKIIEKDIKVNVTAVFTYKQIDELKHILPFSKENIVSIFAGRISDTGREPVPFIKHGLSVLTGCCEILWASTRHVYNIFEAERAECDIITVTPDQIKKLILKDKDLDEYSLETVQMFYNDALTSGLTL